LAQVGAGEDGAHDSLAHKIYDTRPYLWDSKQAVKKHEWEEAMKIIEEMEKEG
jgi:hypothetical protein